MAQQRLIANAKKPRVLQGLGKIQNGILRSRGLAHHVSFVRYLVWYPVQRNPQDSSCPAMCSLMPRAPNKGHIAHHWSIAQMRRGAPLRSIAAPQGNANPQSAQPRSIAAPQRNAPPPTVAIPQSNAELQTLRRDLTHQTLEFSDLSQ